ncbi:hypothetical protein ACGLWX_18240 [Halomonas sp. HMF6819]|uniref:hypothetical protein n=1 Tax=Halomonas sp. HMF6819 TaxID=3373085 RepID=UPI0037A2BA66
MAIDANWCRENPEEAAKQIEMLSDKNGPAFRKAWDNGYLNGREDLLTQQAQAATPSQPEQADQMITTEPEWPGQLTRLQAIGLLDATTDREAPYWENIAEEFYDEETDTMPSVMHLFAALGITKEEYKAATGAQNVNWPGEQ